MNVDVIRPVIFESTSKQEIYPDSRAATAKNVIRGGGLNWVPIFCANCGCDGGMVPEENMSFAFYLCQPCADKWGHLEGTYMEPDAVFWQRVKEFQLEKYGRELSGPEIAELLKDGNHPLSLLARDRQRRGQ